MEISKSQIKKWEVDAENNDIKAAFNLGFALYRGIGIERNYEKALYWFQKAAKEGHPGSEFHIACIYDQGHLGKVDYVEAVHWYKKAAEHGQVNAQCNLALCLMDGEGIEQDYQKAIFWLEEAAKKDSRQACLLLEEYYGKNIAMDE